MTFYNLLSSILSYVFTVIIYLFIFGVIRLIYLDVKKMSRFESDSVNVSGVATASLRTLPTKKALENPLKKRYMIYGEAIIGRNKSCDVSLREKFVSAQHVRIWYEDGEWLLEDLGSRNGTTINGQRIAHRVILDPQDEISVGGIRFVFEL
ncbi:MAG: FHA domain-containing protein [Clostridia bacterium]|nr:FHA domain-containing protein [Clostridia bacterium]